MPWPCVCSAAPGSSPWCSSIEARVKIFARLSLDGVDRLVAERRLAEMEAEAVSS
jgi:hypothetical protein